MNLFQCRDAIPETGSYSAAIETPLGIVRLKSWLGGVPVEGEVPSAVYRVLGDGRLIVWQEEDFDIELLICRPRFSPPLEMQVAECWAALWRVRAKSLLKAVLFWAEWDDSFCWTNGGPSSGQYLYAKTWEDGRTEVTIGTQDDERLALRAREKDRLPPEWKTYFHDPSLPCYAAEAHNNWYWMGHPLHNHLSLMGLASPLPALKEGQEIQIQFAVAWTECSELSDVAASAAVEASAAEILAGGGCS